MTKERVSSVGLFLAPRYCAFQRSMRSPAQCRNNRAPLQLQAAPIRLQGGLPSLKFKSSWMCCLCPFLDSTPAETLCYAHNGRPLPNNKALVESVDAMLPLGQQQSLDYNHNRFVLCKMPITAPISKNSFILPGNVVSSASSFLKTMTERKDRRLMLHVTFVVQFREEEVTSSPKVHQSYQVHYQTIHI